MRLQSGCQQGLLSSEGLNGARGPSTRVTPSLGWQLIRHLSSLPCDPFHRTSALFYLSDGSNLVQYVIKFHESVDTRRQGLLGPWWRLAITATFSVLLAWTVYFTTWSPNSLICKTGTVIGSISHYKALARIQWVNAGKELRSLFKY